MTSEKQYLDLYLDSEQLLCQGSSLLMNQGRKKAFEDFKKLGFPSKKVERYKYSDMDAVFSPNYGLNIKRIPFGVDPYKVYQCSIPQMGSALYYVVNDMIFPAQKSDSLLPEGIYVGSIKEYSEQYPEELKNYYSCLAKTSEDGITALNTALAQDGLLILVAENTKIEQTLQIVNICVGDMDFMNNRRSLIVLGRNAEINVLMCHHVLGKGQYLSTHVAEIYLADDSQLNLYSIEESNAQSRLIENIYCQQDKQSRMEYGDVTLTNGFTRRSINFMQRGNCCQLNVIGAIVAHDNQHIDNNLLVDHQGREGQSDIVYKYVLDGQAEGAFAGKVLVRPGAMRTASDERNSNLCVSSTAKMHTQPMLEIYADDVKCNHGSTVGQMDQNALFYMAQRGIPSEEAKLLMQHAFVNEVIQKIKLVTLRQRLSVMVDRCFRRVGSNCADCGICKNKSEKKND